MLKIIGEGFWEVGEWTEFSGEIFAIKGATGVAKAKKILESKVS